MDLSLPLEAEKDSNKSNKTTNLVTAIFVPLCTNNIKTTNTICSECVFGKSRNERSFLMIYPTLRVNGQTG